MMKKKMLLIPSLLIVGTLGACDNKKNEKAMDNTRDTNPYTHISNYEDVKDNDYYRIGYENNAKENHYGYYDASDYRYNNTNYHNKYNKQYNDLAVKIGKESVKVTGVEKVRVDVYNNTIVLAIVNTNASTQNTIEKEIRQRIAPDTKGKDVKIYFGQNNYENANNMNLDIMNHRNMDISK